MASEEKADRQWVAGLPKDVVGKSADMIMTKSDDYRNIYANNANVRFSTWDVAVNFGQVVGEKDNQAVVETLATVTMSRELAKVLTGILTAHITQYEKDFGEIKIPIFRNKDAQSGRGDDESPEEK
jgi:hypothetical protein